MSSNEHPANVARARMDVADAFRQAYEAGYMDAAQYRLMSPDDQDRWRPTSVERLPERLNVLTNFEMLASVIDEMYAPHDRYSHLTAEGHLRHLKANLRQVYGLGLKLGGYSKHPRYDGQ